MDGRDMWMVFFVKWRNGREKLDEFLSHISNLSKHIKFTMGIEKYIQLTFLDFLFSKKNGKLGFQVYRKKTHTD